MVAMVYMAMVEQISRMATAGLKAIALRALAKKLKHTTAYNQREIIQSAKANGEPLIKLAMRGNGPIPWKPMMKVYPSPTKWAHRTIQEEAISNVEAVPLRTIHPNLVASFLHAAVQVQPILNSQ